MALVSSFRPARPAWTTCSYMFVTLAPLDGSVEWGRAPGKLRNILATLAWKRTASTRRTRSLQRPLSLARMIVLDRTNASTLNRRWHASGGRRPLAPLFRKIASPRNLLVGNSARYHRYASPLRIWNRRHRTNCPTDLTYIIVAGLRRPQRYLVTAGTK